MHVEPTIESENDVNVSFDFFLLPESQIHHSPGLDTPSVSEEVRE